MKLTFEWQAGEWYPAHREELELEKGQVHELVSAIDRACGKHVTEPVGMWVGEHEVQVHPPSSKVTYEGWDTGWGCGIVCTTEHLPYTSDGLASTEIRRVLHEYHS